LNRVVYIPIEKKNRELFSKLLIASELVNRDIDVVLGFYHAIFANASSFPPGVMYFKGLNKVQYEFMELMRRAGHTIVATDEEALGSVDFEFSMRDCWRDARQLVDRVYCQGLAHREGLVRFRGFQLDQLPVTGNSRIDLLRPPFRTRIEQEADHIRRQTGPFVLVYSDSVAVNSRTFDEAKYRDALVEIGWMDPDSKDDWDIFLDHLEHDRNNMSAIRDLLIRFRDFPERKVVLRPHPDEDVSTWTKFAEESPNLSVVSGTEALPWMMASDCVIQTGCTTGVEAAVLGVPCIGLIRQPSGVRYSTFR